MKAIAMALAMMVVVPFGATANHAGKDGIWKFSEQEKFLVAKSNDTRRYHGKRTAKRSYWLSVVAAKRSSSMKHLKYFAHSNPYNGRGAWDIMKRMKIAHRFSGGGAENIVRLMDCNDRSNKQIALKMRYAWIRSYPHRRQLLDNRWNRMGIGIVKQKRRDGCTMWWGTMILARS